MSQVQTQGTAFQWQAWIAQNLLRGAAPHDLVQGLVDGGYSADEAQQLVADAVDHPYLSGARTVTSDMEAARLAALAQPGPAGSARAKKYAWFLEVARRTARQSTHHGEVARVQNPSAEEFLEGFYARNRPCVIEGAMADWPALERWASADYLTSRCGNEIVEVQTRGGDPDVNLSEPALAKRLPFSEFVDIVESGIEANDWYMIANNGEHNVDALLPLLDDIVVPPYLVPDPAQTFIWYGPKGIVTPVHHDLTNNLMAQVRGRKHVRLIAPYESAHVYNHAHRYSKVDPFDVDLERFPDMRDVTVLDVVIGPGDMLFVPVGWWHTVRGLDVSISLTLMHFVFDNDFYSFYETFGAL